MLDVQKNPPISYGTEFIRHKIGNSYTIKLGDFIINHHEVNDIDVNITNIYGTLAQSVRGKAFNTILAFVFAALVFQIGSAMGLDVKLWMCHSLLLKVSLLHTCSDFSASSMIWLRTCSKPASISCLP